MKYIQEEFLRNVPGNHFFLYFRCCMQGALIILLILAILLVIFTLQNAVGITINIFFWEVTEAPLVLVLLVCILAGSFLSSIYYLPKIWSLRKERNALRRMQEKTKEEASSNRSPEERMAGRADSLNPEGSDLDEDDTESFFTE
jgi:lipopolysaccharide assembly protein A